MTEMLELKIDRCCHRKRHSHYVGGRLPWMLAICCFWGSFVINSVALLGFQSGAETASGSSFPAIDETLPESEQVIIRAVHQSNPRTAYELANALRIMIDLDQIPQARFFLNRLNQLTLNDEQLFQLHEQAGLDFFLELHATEALLPESREFARKVLSATQAVANSPARLDQLVRRISDPDQSVRSTAFRQLRRLGPLAAVELLHAFRDPDRAEEFPYLRGALKAMGDDALEPLLAAARADDLQVQTEAIRALVNFNSTAATETLMRSYLSPQVPRPLQWLALDGLVQSNRVPAEPQEIERLFYQRAYDWMRGKEKFNPTLTGQIELWKWDRNNQQLQADDVPIETASRKVAARLAADLYEINPDDPKHRRLYWLAQLESLKRFSGAAIPVDLNQVLDSIGEIGVIELEQVLIDALKLDLVPAATACCELLGEIGTAELLYSQHSGSDGVSYQNQTTKPRALIAALRTGDRYLQFAALQAIIKLDPERPYPGVSTVLTTAAFLANSDGKQSAMVADRRLEFAQNYAALMQASRINGRAVSSSRQLFDLAVEDPDVTMILISDSLERPSLAEFLTMIRSDIRTRRLPIGILNHQTRNQFMIQRMVENDPLLIAFPPSLETAQISSQVRRLQGITKPWGFNGLDQQIQAAVAAQWIGQLAADREKYHFYDLGSQQNILKQLIYRNGMDDAASQILSKLATPTAQRELLNFISQSSYPIEARQRAATAFADSIQRAGIMLTRQEILNQYDRYNATVAEPEEVQQLFGSVLDAMETRSIDK